MNVIAHRLNTRPRKCLNFATPLEVYAQLRRHSPVALGARNRHLYKADSISMHGIYMYEVSAGVTASQGQSEDALYDGAKGNLDAFLKGLSITDAARKIVRPALR